MRTFALDFNTYNPQAAQGPPILGAGHGFKSITFEPVGCGGFIALSDAPFKRHYNGLSSDVYELVPPDEASWFTVLYEGDFTSIPDRSIYMAIHGCRVVAYPSFQNRIVLTAFGDGEFKQRTNKQVVGDVLYSSAFSVGSAQITSSDSGGLELLNSRQFSPGFGDATLIADLGGGLGDAAGLIPGELVLTRYLDGVGWFVGDDIWLMPGDGIASIRTPIDCKGSDLRWSLRLRKPVGFGGTATFRVNVKIVFGRFDAAEYYYLNRRLHNDSTVVQFAHTNKRGRQLVGSMKHSTVAIVGTNYSVKPTFETRNAWNNVIVGDAQAYPGTSAIGVELSVAGGAYQAIHQLTDFRMAAAPVGFLNFQRGGF